MLDNCEYCFKSCEYIFFFFFILQLYYKILIQFNQISLLYPTSDNIYAYNNIIRITVFENSIYFIIITIFINKVIGNNEKNLHSL